MPYVEIPSKQVGPPPIHRPNQKGVKGKGRKGEKRTKKIKENPTTETQVCEPQRRR